MNEGKLKGQEAIDNGLMELLEEKGKKSNTNTLNRLLNILHFTKK